MNGYAVLTMTNYKKEFDFVMLNSKSQRVYKVTDEVTKETLIHEKIGDEIKIFIPQTSLNEMKIRIS